LILILVVSSVSSWLVFPLYYVIAGMREAWAAKSRRVALLSQTDYAALLPSFRNRSRN
jgi:hypothetical protein